MTDFQQRVLNTMPTGRWIAARWLSEQVWPSKMRVRAGRRMRMGAVLHAMYRVGLVSKRVTDTNQNQWTKRIEKPKE